MTYLVLVDRVDLAGPANERVVGATSVDHVADQMFLPVVRCQDGDLFGWIAQQSHVHEHGHNIFGLGQILEKVRVGLGFPDALEVVDVDQLEIVAESGVGHAMLGPTGYVLEIAQFLVTPLIK